MIRQDLRRNTAKFLAITQICASDGVLYFALKILTASTPIQFNLDPSAGRVGVCGFRSAGHGATTQNSHSIPRSCNAVMRS
ncbi:hypothetical protein [Nitrosomonas nitrosa]|uniref:hypothetical protein n=1 Tax=Nitrosomonas nitrosa TaxID=52442 RepID=UPI00195D97C5|nr:hypothetical protein [Nitrosomonas nitrosa]